MVNIAPILAAMLVIVVALLAFGGEDDADG
jgi:hypothetical protein